MEDKAGWLPVDAQVSSDVEDGFGRRADELSTEEFCRTCIHECVGVRVMPGCHEHSTPLLAFFSQGAHTGPRPLHLIFRLRHGTHAIVTFCLFVRGSIVKLGYTIFSPRIKSARMLGMCHNQYKILGMSWRGIYLGKTLALLSMGSFLRLVTQSSPRPERKHSEFQCVVLYISIDLT